MVPLPFQQGMNASPAGYHTEGHRMNNPARFADIWKDGFHHWTRKEQPTPGALAYAFESLGLVEFTPIGAGVAQRVQLRPLAAQSYLPAQLLPLQGLGGIVAGQVITQPLIDPYNQTFGGVSA